MEKSLDMTNGKPLRLIIRFALPMLIGAAFQQLYSVVDMLIVGNVVGSRALAAIGATASTSFLAMSLTMALSTGYTVVASRYFGAKEMNKLKETYAATIYISVASVILLALGGIFGAEALMRLLNVPDEIFSNAVLYVQICVGCSAGMVMYNCATAMLRAVGDSRTPLIFLIISSLLNIILDFVFVLAFGMGVMGVAVATVISQCATAVACMIYMYKRYDFFKLTRSDFKVSMKTVYAILRIGIPICLQNALLAVGDMTITGVVNSAGTNAVAAFATGNRIMQFGMMFMMQPAMALSVFAGQNIGAKKPERIKYGFRDTAVITLALSVVIAGFMFIFGEWLIRLFIDSNDANIEEIVPIALSMLRVYMSFYVFLGAIWLYNNVLRGMGDVLVPFISGLTELVIKVGLSILFYRLFGVIGIWFANPIGWILGIIPSAVRYHRGKWVRLADSTYK